LSQYFNLIYQPNKKKGNYMKCDFCGVEHPYTEMLGYPQKTVEAMVSVGFVPTGFKRMVRLIAPSEEPESYFRRIVSRFGSNEEWGLCFTCRSEMQQYAQKITGLR
jgi:hypothetical protein